MLRTVELETAGARRVKGYSLGMRQRLGLAGALLGDPELLILDEPANGLDPEGVRWLRDFLRAFAAGGRTVLVSSHVLAEVAQTVDQVLIINRGRLVIESSLAALTARAGGTVRVRTAHPDALMAALAREHLPTTREDETLFVRDADSARVGEIAFAAGIPVHELVAGGSSLEEIFLELTAEHERMIAQLRAELLKVRSTRTTLGLVAGMIALTVLIVVLSGLLTHPDGLTSTRDQLGLLSTGGVALIFSGLAGVLLITSEYRYGTIHPTFLFTPRRSRVLTAKLAAGLLTGLVFGVAGVGCALGIGLIILSARGIPSALSGGQTSLLAFGGLAGIALRGALGVGLGAIVRNQVAAVIGLLAWDFVVNGLLFGLAPSVGRFMPTAAANALMGLKTAHLLPPGAGGAVLFGWAAILAVAGIVLTQRRDPT